MGEPLRIDVLTLFPPLLEVYLGESMMKRAARMGAAEFRVVNPRDFTTDIHRTADDRPYGGGPGMVLKPEPLVRAVEHIGEPGLRIDIVQPRGLDQRVEDGGALTAAIGSAEQPGLATERHAAQRPFCRVVGQADAPVIEEAGEPSHRERA